MWPKKEVGTTPFWVGFLEHYEQFTGLLCAAARFGCDSHREAEYARLRHWLMAHYAAVSPALRPYLAEEFPSFSKVESANSQDSYCDVLARMFRTKSLNELLQDDAGDLIPTIGRISDAVYRCDASKLMIVS
jgi:hypothetical protein